MMTQKRDPFAERILLVYGAPAGTGASFRGDC